MMLRERFAPYQLVGKVMGPKKKVEYADMLHLMSFLKSEIISQHCPSPPENHHLINKNTIQFNER